MTLKNRDDFYFKAYSVLVKSFIFKNLKYWQDLFLEGEGSVFIFFFLNCHSDTRGNIPFQ